MSRLGLGDVPSARISPVLTTPQSTHTLLPISLRLAKPGAMGVCLGDLPRLGALEDHCLLPSPRALSLQGTGRQGQGKGWQVQGGRQLYTVPLLSSSSFLLQSGTGAPCPAFLLAPNQFFFLWWSTAAPCSTATTATTVHGSYCVERSDKSVTRGPFLGSHRAQGTILIATPAKSFPKTPLLSGHGLSQPAP